jgi:hypothetical protein
VPFSLQFASWVTSQDETKRDSAEKLLPKKWLFGTEKVGLFSIFFFSTYLRRAVLPEQCQA